MPESISQPEPENNDSTPETPLPPASENNKRYRLGPPNAEGDIDFTGLMRPDA